MNTDKWEFYKSSKDHAWHWRRTAENGKITGASTQGYSRHIDCLRNAERNGYVSPEAPEPTLDPAA